MVAEFSYRPVACGRHYRVIVLRKRLATDNGQMRLFEDYRYFSYIRFIRFERARGLKKADMLIPIWSCVINLQTRRSACPPVCCTMPSASEGTSIKCGSEYDNGQVIFTIDQAPATCRC